MLASDLIRLTARAIVAHPLRSFLTLLGIAVGVTAVILLTAIGEGVHRFVLQEFTQFGTNVMQIAPGKIAARGGPPGLPTTARPLTIEDALALRRLPGVVAVTPMSAGNAEIEGNGRLRRTAVYGVGPEMPMAYSARLRSGRFLPADDPLQPRPLAVLGTKLKQELFGSANPLGQRLRIAGERFRVIGVMAPKGQFLGTDLDDSVFIPAARALAMTNRAGLQEINLAYEEGLSASRLVAAVRALLKSRHGREDFTVITQQEMLRSLSKILNVLTAAVGALGGISLLVGGVGIVTIMTIAVAERRAEVALLVALGARRSTILTMFLAEAVLLSLIGGMLGLLIGAGLAVLAGLLLPGLPVAIPWPFVAIAEALAGVIGLAAGVLPARRAARLDPVEALHTE